ncbi:tripartite tricarboxylate transporter TctB family protein [Bordetella avium]|uniref:Membrane protein n=1 Tax=Bordetella avium (strain 197N) TaxID=360910 RepID=Q2KVB4_BORA1|nr:tripartite tricarboxylate transporter TctB family protein [Bordetella avium]AZY50260.1 tripartite tricarboxylate transporter TctB family protein [Bordetella avium]AZY53654.1 tripartite tricarboxylate transporter TctB family protein [Bordetella avium]RIQ15572.1 tripartite tricarboxylate transporter TctB family protein [Bordetella avium]RIQ19624.1 tripartite tricarboxylate transporter TctB family protein [Bordetella avium]RIQ34203.1 tripartite tricarboxylate transporter TctB family protein [B
MQLRNRQDFWSGVMFIILGLGFSWQASSYQMGTAARMGPGYFPFWLGLVLALLGAIVLLSSLSKKATETHVDRFDWRVVFLVIGSVVVYALVLKLLGVYISVFLLVVLSSVASHEFNLKVAIANGIFLAVFSYLAFIKGLGLIFPLWPSFI